MKWLSDFKATYDGWSNSTKIIATGAGLVLLWSTGLFPIVAFAYVAWIAKKWWDEKQSSKAGFQPQVNPSFPAPQPPHSQPVSPSIPMSSPPPVAPPPPPPTHQSRPTIDWDKP
jgi:hypothetical protein